MSRPVKMTKKNSALVLARLAVFIGDLDGQSAQHLLRDFNRMLDDQGDMFGTEGQNDPRGDRRE